MFKLHSKSDKTGLHANPDRNNRNIDKKQPETFVVSVENPGFVSTSTSIVESMNSEMLALTRLQISPLMYV